MNAPAIDLRSVSFTYEDGSIGLLDVDLRIGKGDFVAMLAANGSGKTTLLKVLVGLLRPQRGTVRVLEHDVTRWAPQELHRGVGFVLQNPVDQLIGATVFEDVAFGPRNLGLPEDEVKSRVEDALASVVGTHLKARPTHRLSFGEQKRVALAGVLAMEPEVLLLDEPTAGLDPEGEIVMLRSIHRIRSERGLTVLMATHAIDPLPLVATQLCILMGGRVLCHGSLGDVLSNRELLEGARLRMPIIGALFHDLAHLDGLPITELPLTVGEARDLIRRLWPKPCSAVADLRETS